MGCAISKLTKTVEEKHLQLVTLMNKLEVQNRGESSNGQSQTHQHTSNASAYERARCMNLVSSVTTYPRSQLQPFSIFYNAVNRDYKDKQ
nr:hypothetical protein CFP56_69935 [Quercus suber]